MAERAMRTFCAATRRMKPRTAVEADSIGIAMPSPVTDCTSQREEPASIWT